MSVHRLLLSFIHSEHSDPKAFRDGGIVTLDATLGALFKPHKIVAVAAIGEAVIDHHKGSEILMVSFKDYSGKVLHEVRAPEVRNYRDGKSAVLEFRDDVPLAVRFAVVISVKPGIAWYGSMFGEMHHR